MEQFGDVDERFGALGFLMKQKQQVGIFDLLLNCIRELNSIKLQNYIMRLILIRLPNRSV